MLDSSCSFAVRLENCFCVEAGHGVIQSTSTAGLTIDMRIKKLVLLARLQKNNIYLQLEMSIFA